MKHIYLLAFLFFTSITFGQNDLLGEWFIHYTNIDGSQQYSTVMNSNNNITFEDTSFNGSVCNNGYGGNYILNDDDTINITSFEALGGGCNIESEIFMFLQPYLFDFLNYYDTNPVYSYVISGSGENETLTLTSGNNDFVAYGRTPLSESNLFGNWYLNYHSADGIITSNADFGLDHPKLEFLDIAFEDGLQYIGFICNIYEGGYTFDDANNQVTFNSMSVTQSTCTGNNPYTYEVDYLNNILDNSNLPSTLEYTITGEGNDATLVLTNLDNSNFAVFGKYAQPTAVFGNWYLDYVELNTIIHSNYYNEQGPMDIVFTTTPQNTNSFSFTGHSSCNEYFGDYSAEVNTISINSLYITLADCAGTPNGIYESLYLPIIGKNETLPINLTYDIVGTDDDQILTITNPNTGDKAVYGRNENTDVLTKTWYLSRIEIPGNPTIQIPTTESPSLTLTNDINPLTFKTTAFGNGECNAFISDYEVTLSNGDNLLLLDFSPTLAFCESDYEDEYFSIIGFPPNNFSEFEITNNGTTLTITHLLGATLVFGDEPLSVLENELRSLQIHLKNNPVASEINLSISQSESKLNYQIYSIDGKLIKKATLISESINVEDLNSGLYFIRFSNKENKQQTLKFIKQ